MELKDVISTGIEIGNRVNYYWKFCVTTSIVIIGWLVSLASIAPSEPLDYELKIFITLGYLTAMIINAMGLIREYQLMSAIMEEIKAISKHEKFKTDMLNSHVQKMSFQNRTTITMGLYSVIMLGVLYLMWAIY
jgi:hypothetical protein